MQTLTRKDYGICKVERENRSAGTVVLSSKSVREVENGWSESDEARNMMRYKDVEVNDNISANESVGDAQCRVKRSKLLDDVLRTGRPKEDGASIPERRKPRLAFKDDNYGCQEHPIFQFFRDNRLSHRITIIGIESSYSLPRVAKTTFSTFSHSLFISSPILEGSNPFATNSLCTS